MDRGRTWWLAAASGMLTLGFFWVLNSLSHDLEHRAHLGVADVIVDHAFGSSTAGSQAKTNWHTTPATLVNVCR